jgi:tRNA(Leu) C34 or U34 (ribose-2'-O)-methylase TrmL
MDYWEHLDWEVADSWEDVRKRLPDSQVWFLTKTATRLVWDATFQVATFCSSAANRVDYPLQFSARTQPAI